MVWPIFFRRNLQALQTSLLRCESLPAWCVSFPFRVLPATAVASHPAVPAFGRGRPRGCLGPEASRAADGATPGSRTKDFAQCDRSDRGVGRGSRKRSANHTRCKPHSMQTTLDANHTRSQFGQTTLVANHPSADRSFSKTRVNRVCRRVVSTRVVCPNCEHVAFRTNHTRVMLPPSLNFGSVRQTFGAERLREVLCPWWGCLPRSLARGARLPSRGSWRRPVRRLGRARGLHLAWAALRKGAQRFPGLEVRGAQPPCAGLTRETPHSGSKAYRTYMLNRQTPQAPNHTLSDPRRMYSAPLEGAQGLSIDRSRSPGGRAADGGRA